MKEDANDREKAAIIYHLYAGCNDWQRIYIIAHDGEQRKIAQDKYLTQNASRWKRSAKIQALLSELTKQKVVQEADREREIEKKARESERKKMNAEQGKPDIIDYSDPANRRKLYNEVIRDAADDPKTRLDAAKVFEQIQRDDKQAAREQQTQRFYTPKQCEGCEIKAAFAKLTGKNVTL